MVIPSNLIFISHCRDEIIYFYDYIDKDSLLVLLSQPTNQRDREVLNNFILESSARFIQLDEIESFDSSFTLSTRTKNIIQNLAHSSETEWVNYNFDAILQNDNSIDDLKSNLKSLLSSRFGK